MHDAASPASLVAAIGDAAPGGGAVRWRIVSGYRCCVAVPPGHRCTGRTGFVDHPDAAVDHTTFC